MDLCGKSAIDNLLMPMHVRTYIIMSTCPFVAINDVLRFLLLIGYCMCPTVVLAVC